MTYLLIPISLINERIELSEKEEKICKESYLELAGQAARNRGSFYNMLLNDANCKQISLNELPKDLSKVTRVEVINHVKNDNPFGRAFTDYDVKNLELAYQDSGRTLKIFIS